MNRLVQFEKDFGRMGNLYGLFICGDDGWESLMERIASEKAINYGEVLGKHSEILTELDAEDLLVLSTDDAFIEQFRQIIGTSFGINPLTKILQEEEEDDDE